MLDIKINVGIVGVGNAAAAFIQGIHNYTLNPKSKGLIYESLAGYNVSDVNIISAIDISKDKVGKDLSQAIFSGANNADKIIDVPHQNVLVSMGNPLDGYIEETKEFINISDEEPKDSAKLFKTTDTEIVLCLLPSGADIAVKYYAQEALKAGCGFINATPTSLATDSEWVQKYKEAGLPIIGDDLQDQIGSTILHKLILKQMEQRGVKISESYALDVGGGIESLNTIHRARDIKRNIKSESIKSALEGNADIVAGTSDYVPHLNNNRNTLIWIVGQHFNGQEITIDMKVSTNDGANGGAILLDVIRALKISLDRKEGGDIKPISAYGFKNPPGGTKNPEEAKKMLDTYISR